MVRAISSETASSSCPRTEWSSPGRSRSGSRYAATHPRQGRSILVVNAVVAGAGLPNVHQIGKPLAVIPEVARADLNPPRGPVMWMAGDAQRALAPDLLQNVLSRLIGADELAEVQRHDVRILLAANMVLG